MKNHSFKALLVIVLLAFAVKNASSQVVFTALPGNASPYLVKSATNQVVFGFSVAVPAFGNFNPGPVHLATSTSLNGFVSGNLIRTTSNNPALAISNPQASYGASINSTIDINGFPNLTGGVGGTTYYFYLVLSITNTANPQPASVVFSLPTSGSISQNGYSGGITVNNSAGASPTYYFVQTTAPSAAAVARCGAGSVTITASGSPAGGTYRWYNTATGGTALQSSTSATYTSTLVTTTTFYVSYQSTTGAESARTAVTATINPIVSSPYSGAIFSYPFSNNYNDISGNGNNGYTTAAPAITTDRYNAANSAYTFNGSSQFITANGSGAAVVAPNTFTISIWFNTTTTTGGKLIGFGDGATALSGSYDRHLYMTNSGQLYFGVYPNTVQTINTAASYNDGNWHHAVVTMGSGGSTLYVDGVSQASSTAMTTGQAYSGWWKVGGDNLNSWTNQPTSNYFNGKLDDIAVYNRVLTSAEISSSNDINQIGYSPMPVCAGSAISFNAPSITGATYTWTDAASSTQTGQNVTFPSAVSGNYTLTVTGGPGGCSSTATITPTFNTPPSTTFTVTSPITAGGTSTVTYTGTDPASSTWSWTFTGGSPSTGTGKGPFTITYATAGSYTATLNISNASGCNATASQTVVVNAPVLPTLSYSPSTNVYTVGTAISTLTPTSANVGAIGSFGSATSVGSGYSNPEDITTDPSGNFYVTNLGNNTINKYNSLGTFLTTIGTGLSNPTNISFDGTGNAFVTNYGTNSILKITPGGVQTTFASGLNAAFGNTTDIYGNVYVANFGSSTILKYNSSGTLLATFASPSVVDVAVDGSGNIYGLSYSNGTVTKYSPTGTQLASISPGLNGPFGLTLDGSGNIYIADSGNNRVLEYNQSGSLVATINTGGTPRAVTFDATGTLYVTLYANNNVVRYIPTGGYYIDKPLPPGLTFNSSIGAISGTPTGVSPATTYTITARNANGTGSTTINLKVNPQVPIISYPTPLYYTVGTTISPLIPTNTGGAAGSYGSASTYVNVNNSNGMTEDAAGNLYISSVSDKKVYVYNSSGTLTRTITGYTQPNGIIVDAAGTIYVADGTGGTIVKTTAAGVTTTITSSGTAFNRPVALTMDAAGNIFVADYGNGTVYKISAGATTAVPYVTGITSAWGIAVNSAGDLYVSSLSTNTIYKIPAGTTTPAAFVSTGLTSPRNMTIDQFGNIYQADGPSGNINLISPAGVVTNLLSGLDSPVGLAIDPSGNIFTGGYNFGSIYKSSASGYNAASLPAGLTINKYNGVITGTPTTTSAATNYTITATNVTGSSSAVTNITVGTGVLGNYAYMRSITLNNAAVGTTSNLSNFPVLLSIQNNDLIITGACADKVQNPNGPNYDFAFTDASSASELYYQIESYNQTTGTLLVWVRVPTMYAASNNTISFYYGAKTPSTTHNTAFFQNTWTNDYQAVYHFNDAAYSGTTADGTANGKTATLVGFQASDLTPGKIGNAYTFGGTSGSTTANDMEATALPAVTTFTLSAWVNANNTNLDEKIMTNQNSSGQGSGGYKLGVYFTIPEMETLGNGNRNSGPNPTALNNNTWYYIQGVYDGSQMITYVNGVPYKQQALTGSTTYTNTLYIGIGEGKNYPFSGVIDEPRVSSVAKSADWIKMEYVDQNDPVSFTRVSSTPVINTANAIAIGGELSYAWTGASSTDPSVSANWTNTSTGVAALPAFDGSATITIPAGLSNYPKLSANAGIYGLTIANGASFNLNGYTLSVGCNIYNNASTAGTGILYGSNTASGITWNGSLANQTYTGTNNAGTAQLANMTVNNSSAGTVTLNGGPVDVYNILKLTKGNLVVSATPAALTLKSTASATAAVDVIPAGYSITGNVNVERFITGGSIANRGYRLISSPVYASAVSGVNVFSINYIAGSSYTSGTTGTGGGFDKTGNPTFYLYRENIAVSNTSFISGNFRGINTLATGTNINYLIDGDSGTFNIPSGNGLMFFFRGDRSVATLAAETTASYVPTNTTLKTTGLLNQGQIIVRDWYTPTSVYLGWTSTAGNTNVRGFNLIGNPYASPIDWESYNTSATTSGIYANNVSTTMYQLNPVTKNYATYQKGGASTNGATRYIQSGQGFFVLAANSTNPQIIFNESAKSATFNSGSNLLVSKMKTLAALSPAAGITDQHMRLKVSKDSVTYDDTYIGFSSTASDQFVFNEDAEYKPGIGKIGINSISKDNIALAIDKIQLPKVADTIRLNVKASTDGIYQLNMTELKGVSELYEIWLMDAYAKDSLDIRHNPNYAFNLYTADTASYGAKRFSIIIRQNSALALHLLSFTAVKATGGAQTAWKVENEQNYTSFTVERSTNGGVTFDPLGGFTSTASGVYSFLDKNPAIAADQYRLKLEDLNGNITYSSVITLMYGSLANSNKQQINISVYPNPATSAISVAVQQSITTVTSPVNTSTGAATQVTPATGVTYDIKIFNIIGAMVSSSKSAEPKWSGNISSLVPGTYIIQVLNDKDHSLVGKSTFIKL